MTREEYDLFNKSRGVTLELCIKRHGAERGKKMWDSYRERQAYTNSEEYLGFDGYKRVNKLKSHTLENYIDRYGDDGKQRFVEYFRNLSKTHKGYSAISQKLFDELVSIEPFNGLKCYYGKTTGEYGILCDDSRYRLYDFVCPELNICIEYHGDHYHGNPDVYGPGDYLIARGVTNVNVGDKWAEDEYKRTQLLKHRGYDMIVVWDTDYVSDPESVVNRIIDYVYDRIQ
jgi:hypothetical protein